MDWNIAVLGSVGSGKTTAIRAISDIEVVDTDVKPTDEDTLALKDTTTVAMDMGVMELGSGDRLRLYGAPGQDRFDFMWEILLEQAKGAVLFVDHTRAERFDDLTTYLDAIRAQKPHGDAPLIVAVTHAEADERRNLDEYRRFFSQRSSCTCSICQPPVMWCDAREQRDVALLMVVMAALLESFHAYPESVLHERMSTLQVRA